jgi:hypothetical protein
MFTRVNTLSLIHREGAKRREGVPKDLRLRAATTEPSPCAFHQHSPRDLQEMNCGFLTPDRKRMPLSCRREAIRRTLSSPQQARASTELVIKRPTYKYHYGSRTESSRLYTFAYLTSRQCTLQSSSTSRIDSLRRTQTT